MYMNEEVTIGLTVTLLLRHSIRGYKMYHAPMVAHFGVCMNLQLCPLYQTDILTTEGPEF